MLFIYSKFKLRKWKRYTSTKRLKILQALEKKLAKQNHRDPIDVVVHERSDWHCFGMFSVSNGQKKLFVHENLIINPAYRFHALETIIHEGRHASQYVACNKENIPWWNFKAKRWKKNFSGYFSSSEDSVMYNNQDVERDAQSYTIKKLKRLAWKYRNETDFQKTLDRNIYRFEHADDAARKKYGLFYKFKMRRKIDKKSKR